jgi:CubicO group peptidase (beta-lactamase class C family)
VERTKSLAPDYAIDWDRFVSEIAKEVDDRVVGYALALAHSGAIARSRAWGVRRHAIDDGALPFTTKTQAQTASAAKLVSATAIVKALYERGLNVDAKIAPFLPSCMEKGPGVSTITFRQILTHTTGLRGARGFDSKKDESCNGRDPYECLLDVLAQGRKFPRVYGYNNKAYDLLRFLVPLVADTTAAKADFEQFDCENKAGVLHRRIAEKFARYVRDKVLKPVGSDATWYPSGAYALNYNCNAQLQETRCNVNRKGEAMTKEYFLRSGSGKMAMTALDYVRFLSALDRGLILPSSLVEGMKQGKLGFDTSIGGKAGPYFWKNGGCPSLDKPQWGRGCKTLAMVFPGDVQAYIAINSSGNSYTPNIEPIFRNAFDAALE